MIQLIVPKLPMRNKQDTLAYYQLLGAHNTSAHDYPDYLILQWESSELHFFSFPDLNPLENDGQLYIRVANIEQWYAELLTKGVKIHPAGNLKQQPWGQKEFSLLDPDHNLLTFGEAM